MRHARASAVACAALVLLLSARAAAQTGPSRAPRDSNATAWYAGITSGWYFPIQKWQTSYVLGGGGTLLVGRQIRPRMAVELEVNMWLLSGDSRSTWDFKAAPVLVWNATHGRFAPYVAAGVGIDLQANYPARSSTLGPMIPLGGGVRLRLGTNRELFVQSLYYVLFRSSTTRDVPLLGGFRVGL